MDDTFEEANRIATRDDRVRILRQTNSGKAHAFENGLQQATNDIIVFLDTDTHFMPDTLSHLVAPLADPRLGGSAFRVSGCFKFCWLPVRHSFATHWFALHSVGNHGSLEGGAALLSHLFDMRPRACLRGVSHGVTFME